MPYPVTDRIEDIKLVLPNMAATVKAAIPPSDNIQKL